MNLKPDPAKSDEIMLDESRAVPPGKWHRPHHGVARYVT